jgi:transposase-like protein
MASGHRHGRRPRQLVTTFGPLELSVPRARLRDADAGREWKSQLLPAYKRLSHRAEALIAQAYLAGMNTRRVRRALAGLFAGRVGKDVVSRAWQRSRSAWESWQQRDLAGEDIVRLILDGTVVKVRLDKKATAVSLLIALGIRGDGQKVMLAIKNMGGESEAAWRQVLDDLATRGMAKPELVIVDGGKGLEAALASLWDDVPVQRCTVHKERNLLAHAPKHLHEEVKADFTDMVHAKTKAAVLAKRIAFLAKWKIRCRPVANSLEEAGERLFTFLRYPPEQWRSVRTTNAIERLHEEFKRRIKTQCVLPCAETAAMLFWALLASGQITLRKIDGWQSLAQPPAELDLAA